MGRGGRGGVCTNFRNDVSQTLIALLFVYSGYLVTIFTFTTHIIYKSFK